MARSEFVVRVINDLVNKKLAIYCGAGISFNSGLPVVYQLLDYLYDTLFLNKEEKKTLYESDIPFERIMETILLESDIDEIKEIFTQGIPNNNHLLIAKLVKSKWLNVIYTTNFDILIEKAFQSQGLKEGTDFKVYRTETELREINWSEDIVKLIKIHGCASQMDEMAITLGQLASNRYLDLRENLIAKIFSAEATSSVLVLGYSCSDFDLVPLIETLQRKMSTVYFIDHCISTSREEDIFIKNSKNPFKKYKGWRYIGDTNRVVEAIRTQLDISIPPKDDISSIQYEYNWHDNFDTWYSKNIKESGEAFAQQVAGKILYSIGAFQEVIMHMQTAAKKNYSQRNWSAYASNFDTMGMAYNKLGKYDEAVKCFKTAIKIQRKLDDDHNLASMLQSYANVLHHLKRDNEALIFFEEALEIAIKHDLKSLESNVLGNMSNSYIATRQFLKANHSLTKAMELSRHLGNKQAESSQLGILASVHLFSGHPSKAIQPLLEAIEIKRTIADYDGLCSIYLNLTTVYHLTNNISKSKETAKVGLKLALKINNQQRINEFQHALFTYSI